MVNINQTMLQPQREHLTFSKPSWSRLFRQLCYMPWLTHKYFNKDSETAIKQAVTTAEKGHTGEIQVVIEGCLPLSHAYRQTTSARALELFGIMGTWDTEFNTGVLLYVNICERSVEIIADRGINTSVHADGWQSICNEITLQLKQGNYKDGVIQGIQMIGQELFQYHQTEHKDIGNELGDGAIFI